MNIFENRELPSSGKESFFTLFENKNVKIEHIISNNLKDGKWYQQKDTEWVILIKGEAEIEFETDISKLKEGDYILIEANRRHRVVSTSDDAHWIALHVS
jgi:cupin 2 domain-containing protein